MSFKKKFKLMKKKSDEQADSQTLYLKFRYVYKILIVLQHKCYIIMY